MNELDITISDLNDISEILDNNGYGGWCKTLDKAVELLKENQPKKYEWDIDEYGIHHCPVCKAINETVYQNFCPGCGADMRKDGDKE